MRLNRFRTAGVKKRLRKPGPGVRSEHHEQSDVFTWAEHARAKYSRCGPVHPFDVMFSIPNAGGFSGGFKANVVRVDRLKREGVKPGVPDILLAFPLGVWPGLFIEMKRVRDSRTSTEQKRMIANLSAVGYMTAVCRGMREAREIIEAYLHPLTERKGVANAPA
jgi:hypothetical protein